jgi:WS/DGAT/MGAT family acyltransferase
MSVILDVAKQGREIAPEPYYPQPEPTPDQLLVEALKERLTSPGEALRVAQSTAMDPTGLPNRAIEAARAVGRWVGGTLDFAPVTSLNQLIGAHRRFDTVTVPLQDLKDVKNAFGGTVNDVVLSLCTGALRRLLEGRGEMVDELELRAMVPVSVRARRDAGALGNKVSSMWAPLPVHEADPVECLRIVSSSMRDLKRSGQAIGAQVLTTLGEYAPPTIVAQAARLVARQRAFNLVITNVPGPQFPLYLLGREMEEMVPVAFLPENHALAVAIMSYNGKVDFGLLGDYDAMPDIDHVAELFEDALDELLRAARGAAPGTKRRKAGGGKRSARTSS